MYSNTGANILRSLSGRSAAAAVDDCVEQHRSVRFRSIRDDEDSDSCENNDMPQSSFSLKDVHQSAVKICPKPPTVQWARPRSDTKSTKRNQVMSAPMAIIVKASQAIPIPKKKVLAKSKSTFVYVGKYTRSAMPIPGSSSSSAEAFEHATEKICERRRMQRMRTSDEMSWGKDDTMGFLDRAFESAASSFNDEWEMGDNQENDFWRDFEED